jgi:hypothetical protein
VTTESLKKIADAIRRGADMVKGRKAKCAWVRGTGENMCLCAQTALAAGVFGVDFKVNNHELLFRATAVLLSLDYHDLYLYPEYRVIFDILRHLPALNDRTDYKID